MGASKLGYNAIVQLLLGASADKDAKNEVIERKRVSELNTFIHMLDKIVWRKHHMASRHNVIG